MNFQKIVEALFARGMTGQQIANKVGCSRSYISNIRNGYNIEPTYSIGAALIELERDVK